MGLPLTAFNSSLYTLPLKQIARTQLEEGYGKWNADQCEEVIIAFAGSGTMLDPNRFEDDQEVLCVVSI